MDFYTMEVLSMWKRIKYKINDILSYHSVHINSKEDVKQLFIKFKWIFSHSRPVIPYLIFIICLRVFFALISIYNVVVSKSLIDAAIGGNSSEVIKWLTIMITITIISMLSTPVTSFFSTHSGVKLNQMIQRKIYNHMQSADWLEQSKIHSVSTLTRIKIGRAHV